MILLELLIALSLTAVLLTFLFSFFVQNAKIESKLETARTCISNRGYLQTRLQTIFTSLDQGSLQSCFYTKTDKTFSLMLQFDQGIDPDPQFSGILLGQLFLDEEKNLRFTTRPLDIENQTAWRSEILFPKIKDFEFEFLGPNTPPESGSRETIKLINPNLVWRSEWPKKIGSIPSMIRLTLYEKDFKEPIRYAFFLPVSEHIQYPGGAAL